MTEKSAVTYSSRIIKASALLTDTHILLAHWDTEAPAAENLERVLRENRFGKASRARIEDILVIFRQRYLADLEVLRALVLLEYGVPSDILNPILYFQAAQADALLHDVVTKLIAPFLEQDRHEVTPRAVEVWIKQQVAAERTTRPWGEETIQRTAQGVLATLRDFGVLQGKAIKRLAPIYLPIQAFAFVAFLLHRQGAAGISLLHSPEWRLFFLAMPAVERLFLEAHQEGLLEYQAAGSIVRIVFPVDTLEEYAHALTRRAD